MNAGFAQNTAKQRIVFLGTFLKDRRTSPNTVCEASREIRTESRFRHQLRRLFDLDARTCRKYKPSAPVLTPNRNMNASLTKRDFSQGKSSENIQASELSILRNHAS